MGREGNIHRDNLLGKILRILCIDVNYDKNIDSPASAHGRGGVNATPRE